MKRKIDVGSGVTLEWVFHEPEGRVGGILDHPRPDSPTGRCNGMIWVDPAYEPIRPHWTIQSEDPLTLTPSLLCHCGFHGFITDGKWVPS